MYIEREYRRYHYRRCALKGRWRRRRKIDFSRVAADCWEGMNDTGVPLLTETVRPTTSLYIILLYIIHYIYIYNYNIIEYTQTRPLGTYSVICIYTLCCVLSMGKL